MAWCGAGGRDVGLAAGAARCAGGWCGAGRRGEVAIAAAREEVDEQGIEPEGEEQNDLVLLHKEGGGGQETQPEVPVF